jgi:hypothetical protein
MQSADDRTSNLPWTELEDTEAVGIFDRVDWSKVSEHLSRDRSSYKHRILPHSFLKNRVAATSREKSM